MKVKQILAEVLRRGFGTTASAMSGTKEGARTNG